MGERPRARTEGILSQQVDGEVVIYDTSHEKAHCLSAETAAVWSRCDGNSSAHDIARGMKTPIETVRPALAQLAQAHLLEQDPPSSRRYSRREVATHATKFGSAAIAASLIYSVAVPPAAFAASGAANGTVQTPAQCPAAAGARAADANCASHTCYQANASPNPRFCVSATCGVFGATCTTFADCCAGQFISDPLHTLACFSGHCAA